MFENYSLTIGVGYSLLNLTEISKSIKKTIDLIIYRIKIGTNKIIFPDNIDIIDYNIKNILTVEKENALINAFETLNKDSIKEILLEIFNKHRYKNSLNPYISIEISKKIMNLFINVMKRFELQVSAEKEIKNTISTGIDSALGIDDIYNTLLQSIYRVIDIINNQKKNQDNKPIREAKKYIQKHYMERLTLSDVARVVNLSADYLSSIFKKEVGINFSDYLINYRLDKAKYLLINTDKTIAFISDKVGYTDSRYFSKLFRDRIGIKPSEYRMLYS